MDRSMPPRHLILSRALATGLVAASLAACSSPDPDEGNVATDGGATDQWIGLDGTDSGPQPGEPWIQTITPERGPLEGGIEVEVRGQEYDKTSRVWFGDQEAEVQYRAGDTRLFVRAPPAVIPGLVDVRVANADGGQIVRQRGFAYLGVVHAVDFEPQRGPAHGGTVITVRGTGFLPGDRVLVGWRSCISSKVIDDRTIVAITPPYSLAEGQDRANVVVAVRHGSGLSVFPATWEYGRAPRTDRVDPATQPMAGGNATLLGAALGNVDEGWADGALIEVADGDASSSRGAKMPPRDVIDPAAKPGAVPLLLDGPFGPALLDPAFAYVDGKSLQLYGAVPASGSTAGGGKVALLVDLAGGKATEVRFGDTKAAFSVINGSLLATAPKGAAGPVPITVVTGGGNATLADAFTYFDTPVVKSTEPDQGATTGGDKVKVHGGGFGPGCTVRFGTYLAQVDAPSSTATTLVVLTPPGAPGPIDVLVQCGTLQGLGKGAFAYHQGGPRIDAVVPGAGATGGGTVVTVFGSGFANNMAVLFDGKPGKNITVLDAGRVQARTPAHSAGPVTVDVVVGSQGDSLLDGYVYFSPTNPYGGTYGLPVKGTINVTVLDIYTLKPLENAFVQVGQPGEPGYPQYGAWTNDKGQTVFAGPDLTPPVTVSATKQQYSASSIVHFDATNATLLLFPWNPPSTGPGKPPTGLPLATLKGHVLDLDKYMLVAPNNCTGLPPICDTCKEDVDCVAAKDSELSWRCAATGGSVRRCLPACDPKNAGTAKEVCEKGFSCVTDIEDKAISVCKPTLGLRKIECRTSIRDMDGVNPAAGVGAGVDPNSGEFVISSRFDELAVYCVGGYVNHDGVFEAHAMGLKRHIFPAPGETVDGLDIRLDIPLKRDLQVWLDHPPKYFPANTEGKLAVEAWLDLGSDGYIPIHTPPSPKGLAPGVPLQEVKNDLILAAQPLSLPKELTDTSYTYRAVATFGDSQNSPASGTLHDGIVNPGDTNTLTRLPNGDWNDTRLSLHTTLSAVLRGEGKELLFATARGYIYRGTLEDPYPIYFPAVLDPYAGPPIVMAAAGTPTDATLVGEEGLIRRLQGDVVVQEQGALVEDLQGVCQGNFGRVAVGLKGGLQIHRGDVWQQIQTGTTEALRGVACTKTGAVAVGDEGRVITVDLSGTDAKIQTDVIGNGAALHAIVALANGDLLAAGDGKPGHGGTLLRRSGDAWVEGWPAGVSNKKVGPLRVIVAMDKDNVLLVEKEGGIHHLGPTGLFNESPDRLDVRPRAGVTLADGRTILVGQPGLWLGPFLSIPEITSPVDENKPGDLKIEWAVDPGPDATVSRVHVQSQGFPFWWLYLAPQTTSVKLPDFQELQKLLVFVNGEYSARVDRIYSPDLSIDAFSTFKLEFDQWRSWATNYQLFQINDIGSP